MQKIGLILAAAVFFILSSALYTVNETQTAIKLRLGEIVTVEKTPGLKFKMPFVNNVVKFDDRIQTLDAPAERFLTGEKKNVIVFKHFSSLFHHSSITLLLNLVLQKKI